MKILEKKIKVSDRPLLQRKFQSIFQINGFLVECTIKNMKVYT